jgi:3-oxoadipate enol-lactonase
VLLCHSIGTTSDLWAPQIDSLARRFRPIRFDARGHGRSAAPPDECSLEDLGRDALGVLDHAGADHAHIVGLSMGGLVAMWLAINAPERVRGLVLAHTSARLGTPQRWADRIAAVRAHGMAAVSDAAMVVWFSAAFRDRAPATVESFRRVLEGCSPAGYAACCAALRDADLSASLDRIRARTLVISGSLDTATTVADGETLRARIPGAQLAVIASAHLGNVEQPARFTELIESFLGAIGESTP